MTIFEKVRLLNLPRGSYVVVSGSALEGYGIRNRGDIDLAVTEQLYEQLKDQGWREDVKPSGMRFIKYDDYEASTSYEFGNYKADLDTLIANATIIEEVAFAPLEEIIKHKEEMGRHKDLEDIIMIRNYLEKMAS